MVLITLPMWTEFSRLITVWLGISGGLTMGYCHQDYVLDKRDYLLVRWYIKPSIAVKGSRFAICSDNSPGVHLKMSDVFCVVHDSSRSRTNELKWEYRDVEVMHTLEDLQNHVSITTPEAAMQFVQLRRSPFLMHCFNRIPLGDEMEITWTRADFDSLTFGNLKRVPQNIHKSSPNGYYGYILPNMAAKMLLTKPSVRKVGEDYHVSHWIVRRTKGEHIVEEVTESVTRNGTVMVLKRRVITTPPIKWVFPTPF